MDLGFRKGLTSVQGIGPTLTAAAAASCLPAQGKKVIPAGFFSNAGQTMHVKANGIITNLATTPGTARLDVRLGGTVVFDGLAVPLNLVAKTSVHWELELFLTLRAVGALANFWGWGKFGSEAVVGSPLPSVGGSGVIYLPYNTTPIVGGNFDATAAQQFDLFFTQTVATGSFNLHQMILEAFAWD